MSPVPVPVLVTRASVSVLFAPTTYVDSCSVRRVLGIECMSEGILPLLLLFHLIWVNANRMLDTKPVCRLVVDEFNSGIVSSPFHCGFPRTPSVMRSLSSKLDFSSSASLTPNSSVLLSSSQSNL